MYRIFTLFVLFTTSVSAQIGIGTTEPHPEVMLDINGALRVRDYVQGSDNAAKDSIAVFDGRGILQRIPTKQLLSNMDKSLVKAKLTANFAIALGSYIPIKFNSEDFDIKNEFNTTTGLFTASDPGIYRVTAQIKTANVSVGDLGLAIYKINAAGTTITKIAEERFVNIAITFASVSPPTRSVSTLVQLDAGEKVNFRLYSAVALNLSGNPEGYDSFCTIEQVR